MENIITYYNIILLLIFTALAMTALYRELRFAGTGELAAPKYEKLWLCLALLIALGLRLWAFGAVPGGINQDGAMAAVDGKALADYGTDRFGTRLPAHLWAWGFGQMSSLLSYLIAAFVKLFGLSVFTARLPQLLVSLIGGGCFCLFVRDAFGKRAGLIAAFLLAVNPWHMMQSRWALDCNLLPHFFMAGLYILHRGLSRERYWLYVSMVFFGLCMYCYGIALYTVSPFLLCLGIYLAAKKRLSLPELFCCGGIWLLVSWPFLMTMAINFFRWDSISLPFVTMQYFPGSVRSGDILFFSGDFAAQLLSNIKSFVDVVILQKKDLPWNDMAGFGTMYKFTLPLALAGLFALCRKRGTGRTLALAGLLAGVFAGLATNAVNINRVNLVFYFVLLLSVLGLELILDRIPCFKLASAVGFVLAAALMACTYFGPYADTVGYYFYDGFGDALIAAEDSGAEVIYVTADAQAEGYAHVSEILTMFYDETDAEYFQGKSNVNKGINRLPYSERFRYVSMDEGTAASAPHSSAFVIKSSDVRFFPAGDYSITYYGGYACAVPVF